jgi:prepilin-type N-terminal cleavage/methylation domain-containing protein
MSKKGFTFVELIIGMTAGAAIALVVFVLFAPTENWLFTQARRIGTTEDSAALMRIVREVGRINGTSNILAFEAGRLRFVDIDGNTVEFTTSGSELQRNGDALAENVQGISFQYLDKGGNATAVRDQISVIEIELATLAGGNPVRLRTGGRLRN